MEINRTITEDRLRAFKNALSGLKASERAHWAKFKKDRTQVVHKERAERCQLEIKAMRRAYHLLTIIVPNEV